jgi:hypothetical protein
MMAIPTGVRKNLKPALVFLIENNFCWPFKYAKVSHIIIYTIGCEKYQIIHLINLFMENGSL